MSLFGGPGFGCLLLILFGVVWRQRAGGGRERSFTVGTTVTFTVSQRVLKYAAGLGLVLVGLAIGMVINAQTATAQAGAVEDTAYTAITPCASFDSRTDTGALAGQYSNLEVRDFQITGTAPGSQQGGVNCGVPADADAVLVNIVAISPTTGGNFRAFATGDTGTGGVVNYAAVSPNLNNSNAVVIPLSASGEISIQNNCGGCAGTSAHARGIILGYFTDNLATQVQQLFSAFDPDGDGVLNVTSPNATTIRFEETNLQLVDGTGDTTCTGNNLNGGTTGFGETCNGQGNLIIGYNEDFGGNETRTGTHSLIIGQDHTWASYGHLIAGFGNTATGINSSVTGGFANTASGADSSVTGGSNNTASGLDSSVTGGQNNTASGFDSSVAGGDSNIANGSRSSVTGGFGNTTSGTGSSVAGGNGNTASGGTSSVIGGELNEAASTSSVVVGGGGTGNVNRASGEWSVVVGGGGNIATNDRAVAVGGSSNEANGSASVVSGGANRNSDGTFDWRAGTLFENG